MKPALQNQKQIQLAERSEVNVLITGPTGSGKSRLAREIHEAGPRAGKPFVTVNLATLHEGTFESELFGHERGAFTGADQRRVGRIEAAQGGTLFLDEIGELPSRLQARLLEFLQSRKITPVGGNREIQVNVRVIAATHRDLPKAVAAREFREDLFHRLRVLTIGLASLKDRPDDFDGLVHGVLEELSAASGRSLLRISEEVAASLESHEWPGNLRELRNVLEYAVLASEGPEITSADLPSWFREPAFPERVTPGALGVAETPLTLDFHRTLADFEKDYLRRALQRFRGRVNLTARQIGMNKTTLIRRMRVYGLTECENRAVFG